MIIGFDLDGTLCDISGTELNLLQANKDKFKNMVGRQNSELYYYLERKPTFNPRMFMAEDDKGIIITARPKTFESITDRWVKRWYPDFPVYHLTRIIKLRECKDIADMMYKVAENKLEIMRELKVEVYIDDDPHTIVYLRSMTKDIKFLQYGGLLFDTDESSMKEKEVG